MLYLFFRLSKKWSSSVWSGRLDNCQRDVVWTRTCNQTKYLECVNDIQIFYEIYAVPEHNTLNGISQEDRELFGTFEDEFECLEQFCPWTPTDKISGSTLMVKKSLPIQLLNEDICNGEVDDSNRCEVDLRTLIDGFIQADPDQFLTDIFEVEVINRLSKEQQIGVIFELKEEAILRMDVALEDERNEAIAAEYGQSDEAEEEKVW